MKFPPFLISLLLLFTLTFPAAAQSSERVGFGYSLASDGGCPETRHSLMAGYDLEWEALEVRGKVRSRPSGGDCRRDSISYSISAARFFPTGAGFDAEVKFLASRTAASAPYNLSDGSRVLLRPDGGALFTANIPAGTADTVVGALGVSRKFGRLGRFGAGWNLVPVDWAGHEPGRTVHLSHGFEWEGVYADSTIDLGADRWGTVSVGYRRNLDQDRLDVGVGVSWRWGLAAVDSGAPAIQRIAGSPFLLAAPPRDDALFFEVDLGYLLR